MRNEIGERALALEMLNYGWATLEQWVEGACLERYVDKEGGSGGHTWVMLNMVSNSHGVDHTGYAGAQNGADCITDRACNSETCHQVE